MSEIKHKQIIKYQNKCPFFYFLRFIHMKAEYISFPLMYVFYDRTIFGRATTIQLKIWNLRGATKVFIYLRLYIYKISSWNMIFS